MSESEVKESISDIIKDDGLDRKTLFVRSIPFEATSEELSEFFSQFAPIKHAVIVTDNEQKSKGFGFVSFTAEDDTLTALVDSKKSKFQGRFLRVDVAKRRDRKESSKDQVKEKLAPVEKRRARLIVRNLPWSCKHADELKKIFSKYGAVFDAYIPKKKNGQMLGFAFVIMKKQAAAEKAVKDSVGLKINGREVAVDLAVQKSKWEETRENEDEEAAEDDEDDEVEDEDEDVDMKDNVDDDKSTKQNGINESHEEDDDEEVDEGDQDDENDESESESDSEDNFDSLNELKEEPEPPKEKKNKQEAFSIFVRNIPYDANAEDLKEHFSKFGPVKYALPVKDRQTGISKGSAFVAFFKEESYFKCLHNAPKIESTTMLIADDVAPEYVFEGRVLNITSAVDRKSADILATRNADKRKEAAGIEVNYTDKRKLFLLNEGRITENSKLAQFISKTDMEMREKSFKLRVQQLNKNPSLHLSMTRLAIRNLPRSMNAKALKALGRKAVVQFATEVRKEIRQPLSKEELNRSIDLKNENKELEEVKLKKSKHAGVVRQSKVVMEVKGTGDIGRSRGYGFIEFRDHKTALMGLRWLNAHEVSAEEIQEGLSEEEKKETDMTGLSKRKLIAEFAIENAQVVRRRKEKVFQARTSGGKPREDKFGKKRSADDESENTDKRNKKHKPNRKGNMNKGNMNKGPKQPSEGSNSKPEKPSTDDNIKRLIGKKRKQRKNKH